MANNNFDTPWNGVLTHDQVEAAIKAKVAELLVLIEENGVPQGGITLEMLATSLKNVINNAVPNTTTINGKALTSNVTLKTSDLQNDSGFITEDDLPEGVNLDDYPDRQEVEDLIAALVNGAPQQLDTLNELAAALGNNQNFAATVIAELAGKISGIKIGANGQTYQPSNGIVTLPEQSAPDLSGYATTAAMNTALAGKQDTMTFDNAPTAGSNNPVKSGGIKTAIDQVTPTIDANGKWVIGGVATDKDAQGPRGNTVLVNENAVGIQALIVNNVVDGGETEILSAEMGKVIRQNIMRIFNALGTYAFPEGKPILNWGSTVINHSINVNGVTGGLTIDDVEVDGVSAASLPSQIADGKSLSLRLALPSNLYVFDDGVSVKMGGVDITSTTFSEATGEINIAVVTDDVVIVASAMTYVLPSNLAFNLDCKNVGSNAGYWTDLIGGTKFKLTDVTINDSGAVFNGTTSKGIVMDDNDPTQPAALGSKYVDVAFDAGTIEVIAEADSGSLPTANNRVVCPVFINPKDGGLIAAFRMGGASTSYASCLLFLYTSRSSGNVDDNFSFLYNGSFTINNVTYTANGGNNIAVSAHTNLTVDGIVRIDGVTQQNAKWFDTWLGGPSQTRFAVGYYYRDDNGTITETFFKGKINAIRVYSTKLTEQQMIQNYKVDKKRFNLQ